MDAVSRRLAGILAADVVGYSLLLAADEAGTVDSLRALRRDIVDPLLAQHGGRIFKTTGDGLMAEFPSAVQALRCAISIQDRARANPAGLQLRIGLHQGDVLVEGEDLLGDTVNIAARIEPLAERGGICISGRVREDASGKIPLAVEDLGTPALKNIPQPVRIFRVRLGAPNRPALELPDKPSLVVLPFQNMSGDPEQEYFVDGLVEDITTALSRLRSLFVISRNSAFTYKGRAADVRQVGRELGVRYVLEGSVRKAGSRLRITGQLVDAASGAHLWADRFDGAADDVFELQDRITSSVAGAIEPHLQRAEIERAQRKPTQDLGAYDYVLRGMAVLHRAIPEQQLEAQELFTHAFALDPSYGAAYGLAALCVNFRRANFLLDESAPEIAEATRWARLAAANGRDDPIALWCAGYVLAYLAYELEEGMLLIERSCVLNPNSAMAWNRAGLVKCYLGDYAVATTCFERAMRLSPLDPLLYLSQLGMATAHSWAGRDSEAVAWAERARSEQPNYPVTCRVLAGALARSGRIAEARHVMAEFMRLAPHARVSNVRSTFSRLVRDQEVVTRLVEGVRLAGLPE